MIFKTKPFAHQLECFEIAKDKDYWGLFLEPGLGKTKIALDILSYHKEQGEPITALIVCPNTLVENWVDEIIKHSDLSYQTLLGTKSTRLNRLSNESDVYIINYESARIITEALMAKKFRFLILDESTAVKNFKSLQSKACYSISTTVPRRFILSGTPILNSPLDIFAQYKILNPLIFGVSFYRFRGRYAVMGGYMNKQAIYWRNMEELKSRIFKCATRKTKDECLDLPDKLYQVIKVDLTPTQKEIYTKLKEEFIYEFKDVVVTAPIVLTRLMRFSQITAGFTKDVEGVEHVFKDNPKIDWIVDFIDNLDVDRKVVIFCRFRREIQMVEEALAKISVKYVTVHGDSTDRIEKVKSFNSAPDIRCFIGQQQVAGIGITLTGGHYCIFMSNAYNYGDRVQCEDRLHRIGQTNNVCYIDILARDTIDIGIHKTLHKKGSVASMVLGDLLRMV